MLDIEKMLDYIIPALIIVTVITAIVLPFITKKEKEREAAKEREAKRRAEEERNAKLEFYRTTTVRNKIEIEEKERRSSI